MIKIYCTRKAEKLFDTIIKDESQENSFEKWNCDLLNFERKKCFLFVHKETLYGVLLTEIRKKDIPILSELFITALLKQLKHDSISTSKSEEILMLNSNEMSFYCTDNDQRTLGTLRDYKNHLIGFTEHKNNKLNAAKVFANEYLNGIPSGARNYKTPIKLMREKLETTPFC